VVRRCVGSGNLKNEAIACVGPQRYSKINNTVERFILYHYLYNLHLKPSFGCSNFELTRVHPKYSGLMPPSVQQLW
jgi:hypothetical protein